MMPELIAGDDWELHFTVLNPDGSPFDLSGTPTMLWMMVDKNGKHAIQSNEVAVSVLNAAQGQAKVLVPNEVTTRLTNELNFYAHAFRIIVGSLTATVFTGPMHVIADPWAVTSSAQILKFKASQTELVVGNPLRWVSG